MIYLVTLLLSFLTFYLLQKALTGIYKALPERLRLYINGLLDDFTHVDLTIYSNGRDRPWIAQHLTDEQWRQHRRSFNHYSRGVGKYTNFHGGTIGWLKCEGLPPITPEMQAHLEEFDKQYERELLDAGMLTALSQWQNNNKRRQAAIEAIAT